MRDRMIGATNGVGEIYRAGKDVSGENFTIDGNSVVAAEGAEIFNSYSDNIAVGKNSSASGESTIARGEAQSVRGKYNVQDTNNTYAEIVGNGTTSSRSNAYTLDWSGNAKFSGKVSAENSKELATKEYVDNNSSSMIALTHVVDTANNNLTTTNEIPVKAMVPAYFTATGSSYPWLPIKVNDQLFDPKILNVGTGTEYLQNLWASGSVVICYLDMENSIIYFQPRVPMVFTSTSAPTASDGMNGDIWVVIE